MADDSVTELEGTGEEFVALISNFFQIPRAEARARLEAELLQLGPRVAAAWHLANPVTTDEITRFYRETDSYVYALAADHCLSRRRSVWSSVVRRIDRYGGARDVLLYGDGIGTDSIALAQRGHRVWYFDLPGVTARFARFRFEQARLASDITVLESVQEIPCEAFDAVVCIEVLEHLPDPPDALRAIHRALRYGGIAIITESFACVGPEHPSHLPQNLRYAGKTHRLMEDLGFASTYYNTNPVNYPMEFTKVRPGIPGDLLRLGCKIRRAVDSRVRRFAIRCRQWMRPSL